MQKIDSSLIANIPYMEARPKNTGSGSIYELQIMLQTMLNFLSKELPLAQTARSIESLTQLHKDIALALLSLEDVSKTIQEGNKGAISEISSTLKDAVNESKSQFTKSSNKVAEAVKNVGDKLDSIKTVNIDKADIASFKPTEIRVNNFSELTSKLNSIITCLESMEETLEIPEERDEPFSIPTEIVEAIKKLNLISNDPESPISVRLSNGKDFIEALKESGKETVRLLSSGGGFTALKDQDGTMYVAPKVGAGANNTFATVGVASSVILTASANRVSVTLVNDSSNTMYVAKGATAVVGSGIRLNASGGALIIDDFKGAIHAIAGGAGSNMTICEVTFV